MIDYIGGVAPVAVLDAIGVAAEQRGRGIGTALMDALLSQDCAKLHIGDETSKTFGGTINLLLSGRVLREYENRFSNPQIAHLPM